MLEVYKIYNTKKDMYATKSGDFTKKGKVWNEIGHVKNHLRGQLRGLIPESRPFTQWQIERMEYKQMVGWVYKDCVLRCLSDQGLKDIPIKEILSAMKDLKRKDADVSVVDTIEEFFGKDWL